MRWCFTRFGVRALVARAYAAPRVRDSLLRACICVHLRAFARICAHLRAFARICAHLRAFARIDATQVWVARGVVAFFALYILKYIHHTSR